MLEEKLQRILEEFGVDKLSDVLDSEEAELDFDRLFVGAMLDPKQAAANVDRFAEELRQRALAAREGLRVLGESGPLDPSPARRIAEHQLPFWTERMTVAFLRGRAGEGAGVQRLGAGYALRWPDGHTVQQAVFSREAAEAPGATHLTLEDPRLRELVRRLPLFAPGQPLPAVEVPGISDRISGTWSLWRVALGTTEGREQRVLPLFLSDEGRALAPTARALWDRLIELDAEALRHTPAAVSGEDALAAYHRSRAAAEEQGAGVYRELVAAHDERLAREIARMEQSFAARRRAIERVGLVQVRQHRLAQLEREQAEWEARLAAKEQAVPELTAVILLRVARAGEAP